MANWKISQLPLTAQVNETDLYEKVDGVTGASERNTMVQVATRLGIVITALNSSAFTISSYSLTANNAQSMLDLTGTWNTTGTPTAIKLNITDTASNAASLLMDLQVGGSSKAFFRKDGTLSFNGGLMVNGTQRALVAAGSFTIYTNAGSTILYLGDSFDCVLNRDAANTLAMRNAANAQIYRVYGTFTDAANYERLTLTTQAAATTLIDSEAAGTGTRRGLTILSASGTLGFFGVTPVVRQTQGATLTNNVTAGGAANTLANYTDLTLYANDAVAIRNNLYQLGQTLKTIVDGLRLFGLFT